MAQFALVAQFMVSLITRRRIDQNGDLRLRSNQFNHHHHHRESFIDTVDDLGATTNRRVSGFLDFYLDFFGLSDQWRSTIMVFPS